MCDCGQVINPKQKAPLKFPIDGVLDLHTFKASQAKDLIPRYLEACRKRGIYSIRIIHGKGTGALQRTVHSVLCKIKWIKGFHLASLDEGGWGATIVHLKQLKKD